MYNRTIANYLQPEDRLYEASLMVPKNNLDFYGIEAKVLQSGTYGTVRKYTNKSNIYAIKRMFIGDKWYRRATIREISIMIRCNFSGLIRLVDVITEKSHIDVVLEFAEHGDLYHAIRQNTIKQNNKKIIVAELANAIAYLHSIDIIHRDIKPANVLIMKDSSIRLADFGLSRAMSCSGSSGITHIGTLNYIAPEIMLFDKLEYIYTNTVDVWSFACLLYELYTSEYLFNVSETSTYKDVLIIQIQTLGKLNISQWPELISSDIFSEIKSISEIPGKFNDIVNKLIIVSDPDIVNIFIKSIVFSPKYRMTIFDIINIGSIGDILKDNKVKETTCIHSLNLRSCYPKISLNEEMINYRHIMLFKGLMDCYDSNISSRAFQLACWIMDAYFAASKIIIDEINMPKYFLSALAFASDFCDPKRITITAFMKNIHHLKMVYTKQILMDVEIIMLNAINYDLIQTVSVDYLYIDYIHDITMSTSSILCDLAHVTSLCFKISPHYVANLMVKLAKLILNNDNIIHNKLEYNMIAEFLKDLQYIPNDVKNIKFNIVDYNFDLIIFLNKADLMISQINYMYN